jgi:hypothetical protein
MRPRFLHARKYFSVWFTSYVFCGKIWSIESLCLFCYFEVNGLGGWKNPDECD